MGWDQPGLYQAVQWLRTRFTAPGTWDLSTVLIVVPAARAGRRLTELLADQAQGQLLVPPTIITPGDLPEHLYTPAQPIADELTALLARWHSLRQAPSEVVHTVFPQPPPREDLPGWLALAQELARLSDDLAADAWTVRAAGAELAKKVIDFLDGPRWQALADLEDRYMEVLAGQGLISRHQARLAAIEAGACASDRHILLLATVDLTRVARRMLDQLAGPLTALIHAPQTQAAAFDDLGCLAVDHWQERPIHVDPRRVHVVDRPRDQAAGVVTCLEQIQRETNSLAVDQITIGLGDDALAPAVERALQLAQQPTRSAVGRLLNHSRPMLALDALATFLATDRFEALAGLLRHPDIVAFLERCTSESSAGNSRVGRRNEAADAPRPAPLAEQWDTLLDRYLSDHLQGRWAGTWLDQSPVAQALKRACDALAALAPADAHQLQPIGHWSQPIADILEALYGNRPLNRADPADAVLIHTFTQLTAALAEQSRLDPAAASTPLVDLAQAISLTLARLGGQQIPPLAGAAAIELLGWLELPLDDAPVLIITSVNEGAIPQSVNADAFLPDHARQVLGLLDNRRRLARDKAALAAILHSRPHVHLITGRRGADDEPLLPSRLLLAAAVDRRVDHLQAFYSDRPAPGAPLLLTPGRDRFYVPPVRPPAKPITRLRVTAFRDYLACPYRFYLRHILGLRVLDDGAAEMDALAFGNLAHEVFQRFGCGEARDWTDAAALAGYLSDCLDQIAHARYGRQPVAAVLLQIEQLRQRLAALARVEAADRADGWRIMPEHIEQELQATLEVDGQPFTLKGRIDRIDRHEGTGQYRVLDYKTSDTAKTPEHNHRNQDQWTDLQLPLYATLLKQSGIHGPVILGYVQLPKDLDAVGVAPADWTSDDLAGAEEEARRVIRNIRAGVFWPPTYPVKFYSEFAGICMDESLDLAHALQMGQGAGGKEQADSGRVAGVESSSPRIPRIPRNSPEPDTRNPVPGP